MKRIRRVAHEKLEIPLLARNRDRRSGDVRRLRLGAARITDDWHTAFQHAGTTLSHLRETGRLTRGLRTVLALHVIFHWNRLGLPTSSQSVLARAAVEAIMNPPGSVPDTGRGTSSDVAGA